MAGTIALASGFGAGLLTAPGRRIARPPRSQIAGRPSFGSRARSANRRTTRMGRKTFPATPVIPMGDRLAATHGRLMPTDRRLAATNGRLTPTHDRLVATPGWLAATNDRLAATDGWLAATHHRLAPTYDRLAPQNDGAPTPVNRKTNFFPTKMSV